MTVTSRYVSVATISGDVFVYPNWQPFRTEVGRTEKKDSTGHRVDRLGVGDQGGYFRLSRQGYTSVITAPSNDPKVKGTIWCLSDNGGLFWSEPAPPSIGVLNTTGTKLSAAASPTKPGVEGKAFIFELFQGGAPKFIGNTLKERTHAFRKVGDEYLNYQFGWVPFVSDIRDMIKTARNTSRILEQYVRDANRPIRRRRAIPTEQATRVLNNISLNPSPVTSSSTGRGTRTETTTKDVWFVGKFRYYLPLDESRISRWYLADRMLERTFGLGIIPSPDQVWEMMPWSWLVDWFTDLGAVVQNISDLGTDGLVMEYGYVMCHTRYERKLRGLALSTSPGVQVGYDYVSETKLRTPAHPYGFGLTDLNLSSKQLAILGALGLTQGHRGD